MVRFFVKIVLTTVISLFSDSGISWVEIGANSEKSFNNWRFTEFLEVKPINRKVTALTLLSVVAVAALISGVLLTAHATDNSTNTDNSTTISTAETDTNTTIPNVELICPSGWNFNRMGFGRHGFGDFAPIQVSSEFTQNVTNIAGNDSDVQNLLANGYNVTSIRPILTTVIDANGNVVTSATSAILTLQKDTTGHAIVTVDLTQAKVIRIVIQTITVIEKP